MKIKDKPRIHPAAQFRERKNKQKAYSIEDLSEHKLDFLQNLYRVNKNTMDEGNVRKNRVKSFKRQKQEGPSLTTLMMNREFLQSTQEFKSKKLLVEQNVQLKKKLSEIQSQPKGRLSTVKRHPLKKKLETEFEKEMYWSGSNSYMISGVKYQYQKMKENFERKSKDYQALIQTKDISNQLELLTYIEALEVENHILSETLQNISKTQRYLDHPETSSNSIYLQVQITKYQRKIEKLKKNIKENQIQLKEKKRKIHFLEKLIIHKDNSEQASNRISKKSQKVKKQLEEKIIVLEQQIKECEQKYKKEVEQMQRDKLQKYKRQVEQCLCVVKETEQKNVKLQRQNDYMQNLLNCWKEEKNPRREQERNNEVHQIEEILKVEENHNQKKVNDSFYLKTASIKESLITSNRHSHDELNDLIPNNHPFTAQFKYRETAVKNRRLQLYQIQPIIQFMRYVLIAKKVSSEEVLRNFEVKTSHNLSESENQWRHEYISMKEVTEILQEKLFMKSEEAIILSRYLIEHSATEHVYTDEINQHHRTIVKSIIKNLLGDFEISKEIEQKGQSSLVQNRQKMEWTLQNVTKHGVIGKDKLLELLPTIGIDIKNGIGSYFIAKMACHSKDLDNLEYEYLFK